MDHDPVVVVGSGPAGAAASYFLKLFDPGMEVILVERLEEDRFRRYHRMCGEAISSRAFGEIDPIRPGRILNRIREVEEIWPGGMSITSRADGYIIDRASFLDDLVEKFKDMGGSVMQGAVRTVKMEGDGYTLGLSSGDDIKCSHVLGADGACSRIRRELFGGKPSLVVPARQYLLEREMPGDRIRFLYGSPYGGGYRWEFPFGSLTKVGFPAGADPPEMGAIESHSRMIPAGGLEKIVERDACLLGDAAAQANPLTFGGIRVAMLAGKMAARAICDGDLNGYQEWWRSSRFSAPVFMRAYRALENMTDEELVDSMLPFRGGFGPLSYVKAYLSRPGYRDIYRAYRLSAEYGW